MTTDHNIQHLEFLFKNGGFSKILSYIEDSVAFDIKLGTDTSSWLEKKNFKTKPINIKHGVRYRAAATSEIEDALSKVSKLINTNDAGFYDLGCGKGKVLCIAGMQYDYDDYVGVDYYPDFIDIAEKNLKICDIMDVNLHLGDMINYKDFKETNVIFLYNPADNIIIDQVRKNIQKYSKKSILIYNKPIHEDIFKGWDIVSKKTSDDPDYCTTILSFGFNK